MTLRNLVREKKIRLSVIGTGYLGATHAASMAELGHKVVGVDIDPIKIDRLAAGHVPFYEPGLPELLSKHVTSGALRFTTSIQTAAAFADLHFVCVGTPQKQGEYAADLTLVDAAFLALREWVRPGAVVVGKSTVPVGTATRLAALLRNAGVELLWNPEFLREGFAVEDTLRPDRIVIGATNDAARELLEAAYAPILAAGTPVVHTDFATAELVKVAANAFLATKISFINAVAEVCEVAGADVTQVAEAIGHDERIGHKFLRAGLGSRGRLSAQGYPGVHGARRRTRRRPGSLVPQEHRRDQLAVPGTDGRPGARDVRGIAGRSAGRCARRGVQAGQRRHP